MLNLNPSKLLLRGIVLSDEQNYINQFNCGNGSMENFLRDEAYVSHLKREASTTLVFYEERLIAYFTLHRMAIQFEEDDEIKKTEALSLARLAVELNYQDQGVGSFIINKIKEIAYITNERFIQTDALFEKWEWYQRRGFNYAIEEEIDPSKNNECVYMIMDLYDESLLTEYFDV